MARRFGRNFDNPERRIENVESSINDTTTHLNYSSYEDDFDKKLDVLEEMNNGTSAKSDFFNRIKKQINSPETTRNTQRDAFLQEIKVEQS